MKSLRIAVVGCAGMARYYCRRYMQIKNAELALLIDINEELVKDVSQKLGGVRWSTSFEDCLAEDIDVVDISTPNFLHEKQAVAAIEAGKHVIIQKPLAPSVEEAERIVKAAQRSGKNVGMYMSTFNDPLMIDLKRVIDQGYLGQIEGIHCRHAHRGGLNMPAGTWRGDLKKCGGGSFIQLAIHDIDAVQWLLGSHVESVMGYSQNTMCPNVGGDDATVVCCKFENGVLGTLESSYAAERKILSVYGTKGYFALGGNNCLEIKLECTFDGEVLNYDQPNTVLQYPVTDTLKLYDEENPYDQSIAFIKSIQEGRPAPVPLKTGLYDLKVIKAVYKSAETGRREMVYGQV